MLPALDSGAISSYVNALADKVCVARAEAARYR
jgi:hypothetical protein